MIIRNVLTLIAFAGAVALIACSSEEAGDKFGSTDAFCSAKAEAECANLAAKCGATVEACKPKRVAACNTFAGAAVAQGRSYRSSAAQACIDKVNAIYKDSSNGISGTKEQEVVTTCDKVFTGSKAEKEACAQTFECTGDLICDGVCIKAETVSLGAGCANAGQVCAAGTYCQASGGTGKRFCVAKNELGDTCGADAPCIESLRCVNKCVAKVTVGEPCDTDSECGDAAPFCDQSTMPRKCRPKYESTTSACKDYGSGG